ncbi:integrase [Bacillus atrophaeus]|nr:integrase [Bacillus atrophaeus]
MQSLLKKTPSINKRLTPPSLRHTHTSLLAEAGVVLLQIMDHLGHTEDETTTQVYLHITKDRKKKLPKNLFN